MRDQCSRPFSCRRQDAKGHLYILCQRRFRSIQGMPRTLYDRIWEDHLVDQQPDGTCLIYIDRHLVHEVTSPQAFEGLRVSGRKVRAPEKTLCVVDHNVPTTNRKAPNPDPESAAQIAYLAEN